MVNSKKRQKDAENKQTGEKDEIYEILHQLCEIAIVHPITVKKDTIFFKTMTKEIAQDIMEWIEPPIHAICG